MSKKKKDRFHDAFGPNGSEPQDRDWGIAGAGVIHRIVQCVTQVGGAVMFSTTSDGGAFVLTFFHDDVPSDKRKQYCGSNDELHDWLTYWAEFWQGVVDAENAPE